MSGIERISGLDATAFLEKDFPEDAGAIRWLQETVEGQPVVLEAQGDSYSDCERVSAMTGLPTVAGSYVHQWLWRNDLAELNGRVEDVENIYTGTDPVFVKETSGPVPGGIYLCGKPGTSGVSGD